MGGFWKRGEKRNLCNGKISSTCLRWKLVDLKRGRARVTEGRERGSLPPAFLSVKNKYAGEHTRKPGDAHISTNPVLSRPMLNVNTLNHSSSLCYHVILVICLHGGYNPQGSVQVELLDLLNEFLQYVKKKSC